jgi:3D (Asp-Asp-Asp) domain-containing protein
MPGNTLSIDAAELSALHDQVARLDALARRRGRQLHALLVAGASLLALGVCFGTGFTQLRGQLSSCRARLLESRQESSAVATTEGETRHASTSGPAAGLDAWSEHFVVTMYTARSATYGKTDDGLTSTMMQEDPARRIVAVDPRFIPYHSKVWIEGLGWYNAEDCGGAIKGLELDVMAHSHHEAMQFGRQQRRVVVLPRHGARA